MGEVDLRRSSGLEFGGGNGISSGSGGWKLLCGGSATILIPPGALLSSAAIIETPSTGTVVSLFLPADLGRSFSVVLLRFFSRLSSRLSPLLLDLSRSSLILASRSRSVRSRSISRSRSARSRCFLWFRKAAAEISSALPPFSQRSSLSLDLGVPTLSRLLPLPAPAASVVTEVSLLPLVVDRRFSFLSSCTPSESSSSEPFSLRSVSSGDANEGATWCLLAGGMYRDGGSNVAGDVYSEAAEDLLRCW